MSEGIHTENQLARQIRTYGATEADGARVKAELIERFGRVPSPSDIAWEIANEKIPELAQKEDFRALSDLYWQMALQIYYEGRDQFNLAREARRYELLDLQRECLRFGDWGSRCGLKVLGCSGNYCGECKPDKIYTVEEALESMPIPRRECGYHVKGHKVSPGQPGWCICLYLTLHQPEWDDRVASGSGSTTA